MGTWELRKVLEQTKRPDGDSKAWDSKEMGGCQRQKSKERAFFSLILSDFLLDYSHRSSDKTSTTSLLK